MQGWRTPPDVPSSIPRTAARINFESMPKD
jgi:hypothetical protein